MAIGREVMVDAFASSASDDEIAHFIRQIGTDRMRRLLSSEISARPDDSTILPATLSINGVTYRKLRT